MEDSSIDNCESNTLGNLTGISSLDTSLYKAGMSSLRLVSFSFWCSVKGRRFLLAGDIFTKSEEFSSSRVPRPKRLFVAEGFFVAEDGFKNLGDSFCFKRSRKLLLKEVGVETTTGGVSWDQYYKTYLLQPIVPYFMHNLGIKSTNLHQQK